MTSLQSIAADSLITLHYRVSNETGVDLVTTYNATPATLQLGSGELAPPLEQLLIGVTVGEKRSFQLGPDEAFGPHNPQLVQRLGLKDLPANASPEVHAMIEFSSPAGGKFTGIVRELNNETALVDFNHPLAGKPLRFDVDIIGIL